MNHDHDQLTFGDCAELLRMNGYVPAPLSVDTGLPLGPFKAMQIPYGRFESNNPLPVGVLTQVPLPLSPEAPVQDPRATCLVTIATRMRAGLAVEADAIVKRYTGESCPARVEDDGGRRYVLRLAGEGFSTIGTDEDAEGDYLRVSGGPDFIPIAGEWSHYGGLLTIHRSELPEIDHVRAIALVEAVNALLDKHAPPAPQPVRFVPTPLPDLAKGEPLAFGHARAMHAMKENGYAICPVPWGQSRASDAWYMTASVGVQWNPGTERMGVGAFCTLNPADKSTWLAFVEISGKDEEQVARADAAIVARIGAGLLRTASDGKRLRVYEQCGSDRLRDSERVVSPLQYTPGKSVLLRFGATGIVVVSGLDGASKPYLWPNGSPLTVKRHMLGSLNGTAVEGLVEVVRASLQPADAEGAPARGRSKRA